MGTKTTKYQDGNLYRLHQPPNRSIHDNLHKSYFLSHYFVCSLPQANGFPLRLESRCWHRDSGAMAIVGPMIMMNILMSSWILSSLVTKDHNVRLCPLVCVKMSFSTSDDLDSDYTGHW